MAVLKSESLEFAEKVVPKVEFFLSKSQLFNLSQFQNNTDGINMLDGPPDGFLFRLGKRQNPEKFFIEVLPCRYIRSDDPNDDTYEFCTSGGGVEDETLGYIHADLGEILPGHDGTFILPYSKEYPSPSQDPNVLKQRNNHIEIRSDHGGVGNGGPSNATSPVR